MTPEFLRSSVLTRLGARDGQPSIEEPPLRAELFSVEQLERHARGLAGWHQLLHGRGVERLLPRLRDNEQALQGAYERVAAASAQNLRIAPAAEWLLDNFYLVDEQIRTARRHLPKGYSRELPKLANGARQGSPRVYDLALELIQHVDGRVDAKSLSCFIAAYQSIQPMKLGELWAVPIMLRLALIENLRRVAVRISMGREQRNVANRWAERMLAAVEKNPGDVVLVLADMARSGPPLTSAFVAEFVRRIQGKNPSFAFVMSWLEQWLGDSGTTVEQLVQVESQNQAADQVSIGNSIGSLRFLGAMDWRQFVESMSVVEQTLRTDPADVYADMDFATRDNYRHLVERLARSNRGSEERVAGMAVALASQAAAAEGPRARQAHVGYYLVDRGLGDLQRRLGIYWLPSVTLRRVAGCFPLGAYVGGIGLIAALVTALPVWWAWRQGMGWPWMLLLGALMLLPATQLGVGVVNWLVSILVPPKALPRLDFSQGVPSSYRTVVAVPTMLSSAAVVDDLVEELEVRYLANRDPAIHFALLTDFTDAPQEQMPQDAALVERVQKGIEGLRAKYQREGEEIFFLFHRPRRWNPSEGVWMGYERKRGKLAELNAVLRGHGQERFALIVGNVKPLRGADFVITLDSDTRLPRDAARELIATLAHPLNRPRFDPRRQRVTEGYTILQPRVAISLGSASRSWFVRLFAGEAGIDPYTRAVSDVYQDLFAEGSFIGKGIYDIDAFEQACGDRFPENTILSHDLLEGCHARSALVSDVQLFEDYPSRYQADVSRRHRWIRGDWQIAWWLLPRVPSLRTGRVAGALSNLSRWKILDNLRRSLVSPAILAALLLSWLLVPGALGSAMTGLLVLAMALPYLLTIALDMSRRPGDLPLTMHLRSTAGNAARQLAQFTFSVMFLPYDALVSMDAIVRTLWRMFVSRKRLLQWRASSEDERAARADIMGLWTSMWVQPALSAATALGLALTTPERLAFVWPILAAWLVGPGAAWWLSRPIQPRPVRLTATQQQFLQKLARRTWRYFETFVDAGNNWLPPDNHQEHPVERTAPRTSPTNIGLALLANVSAMDFGYISGDECLQRCLRQMQVLDRMERYRGHLYNWYDTRSLQPLAPLYVSSVDSGNFMAHLMVLRVALEQMPGRAVVGPRALAGLRDTLRCFLDAARGTHLDGQTQARPVASAELVRRLESIDSELAHGPVTLTAIAALLGRLLRGATELLALADDHGDDQVRWWARALERGCRSHVDDLGAVAAWASMPPAPDGTWRHGDDEQSQRLAGLRQVLRELDEAPTLARVAALDQRVGARIDDILANPHSQSAIDGWLTELRGRMVASAEAARQRLALLRQLADRCTSLAEMDFRFLYDDARKLLSVGFNVGEHRMDRSFYDLLASEARLGSFVAIARGQLPQEHWFAMGRSLTRAAREPALLSWSGSMFEYLMPLLVMPTYPDTLLDQTYLGVVYRHMDYAHQRGVPWGISESGYNATDTHLNYQYRAFGVPGLGLKRGLGSELVIAPYAAVMSLMILPRQATVNLQRMAAEGFLGRYGMYEAVDYTPARVPRGQKLAIVRSFMVHHEAMSLLSLAYYLLDRPMQRRFLEEPSFKATELLLQERVPKVAPIVPHGAELAQARRGGAEQEAVMRVFTNPGQGMPEVHLLSNGRYHVCISSAGGGYSRRQGIALTRWREDPTRDNYGLFCYFRDADSGEVWSNTYQPTLRLPRNYEAVFTQARAEFRRRDFQIEAHTEISVSPEDDLEVRRITLSNRSNRTRTIEVTTFAEVALAPPAAEMSHPSFSNLFVQTELHPAQHATVLTRRPRSKDDQRLWMVHLMLVQGATVGPTTFETNREKFLGRDRTSAAPAAVATGGPLGNSAGAVLDPSIAVRRTVRIAPDEVVRIDVITAMADTHEAVMALAEKYQDPRFADRVFELAWTHSQVVLRQLNADEADAQLYGQLAGSVIYAGAARRAPASIIARNRRGQSGLWGYGISGDVPIVLVRIADQERIELVRKVIQAHAYWRTKGLTCDLVIWNEDNSVYRQNLHDQIMGLIGTGPEAHVLDKPGGIFVRRGEQISEEDRVLMQTVARVVLDASGGSLEEQIERRGRTEPAIPPLVPLRQRQVAPPVAVELPRRNLLFFNGYGGFTADGREYVMLLGPDQTTPAPWSNVIANASFGTLVTGGGSSYTWADNSHEYRLTPWYNDPVADSSGEAFYIRDEETGRFWSPTPLPARGPMPYVCRHGFGYSAFEYTDDGIETELYLYVATDAPVKLAYFHIRNHSGRKRRLSLTGYNEWCLGELRHKSMMHAITELDPRSGTLLARNAYSADFRKKVAFMDCSEPIRRVTGDRTEFLGRNGTPVAPAALSRARLSGRVGAALDPCAAMQTALELSDGEEREVVFVLGAADGDAQAKELAQRFRTAGGARAALEEVWRYWNNALGTIHVQTPDPAVDVLVNGWLPYQVLSCRVWGRTGFYQSGGAFGFRDQLQDVAALIYAEPGVCREHLLRAAAHQFKEGDVQHWWHPPSGRGVRTRFSDDYLWLPLIVSRYVLSTGDTGVLDQTAPFLEGRPLRDDEESYYDLPQRADAGGTLYEHCVRAIEYGLKFGPHGLPLMGCGDWNDGMNLVGIHGKGESVWLAFFLYFVMERFAPVARRKADNAFADRCDQQAAQLRANIEANAWDGDWYRRAYFDSGEPLGSHVNPECQIDSIAQSWSVLSGAGQPERSRLGMNAVDQRLVRRDAKLIQLFDPPFDKSDMDPGYIKGYLPGVRENGGQYTHAAIWTVMAFAALGDRDRAWELFGLINPVRHGDSPRGIDTYQVEPYVVAADVYTVAGHVGRGGWTWYTGSAGWMYRLILESLLGLRLEVDRLHFTPLLPEKWEGFTLHYRYRETFYHITINATQGRGKVTRLVVDGAEQPELSIGMVDDRKDHQAEVFLGP